MTIPSTLTNVSCIMNDYITLGSSIKLPHTLKLLSDPLLDNIVSESIKSIAKYNIEHAFQHVIPWQWKMGHNIPIL